MSFISLILKLLVNDVVNWGKNDVIKSVCHINDQQPFRGNAQTAAPLCFFKKKANRINY